MSNMYNNFYTNVSIIHFSGSPDVYYTVGYSASRAGKWIVSACVMLFLYAIGSSYFLIFLINVHCAVYMFHKISIQMRCILSICVDLNAPVWGDLSLMIVFLQSGYCLLQPPPNHAIVPELDVIRCVCLIIHILPQAGRFGTRKPV